MPVLMEPPDKFLSMSWNRVGRLCCSVQNAAKVGSEPKIALLDRGSEFAVCRPVNQKDAESYGNRIGFSYRMDGETPQEAYGSEALFGFYGSLACMGAGLDRVGISWTDLNGRKVPRSGPSDRPRLRSGRSPYLPIAARSTNGLEALKADINVAASVP